MATAQEIDITHRIRQIRGQRVLIDSDLAVLYGVTTARLNQQFRRNRERFPPDFAFEVDPASRDLLMLQNATSKETGRGGHRKPAIAYTEHGAIMAATVLNSPIAVQMSVQVVRAFVKFRQTLASNAALAHRLESLERSIAALDGRTREEFVRVYKAILKLMGPAPLEQ